MNTIASDKNKSFSYIRHNDYSYVPEEPMEPEMSDTVGEDECLQKDYIRYYWQHIIRFAGSKEKDYFDDSDYDDERNYNWRDDYMDAFDDDSEAYWGREW